VPCWSGTPAILARCLTLADFPERGAPRDDIRPGLRTIPYGRRYTIDYRVDGGRVIIPGITGRGQPVGAMVA
jgi:toxin ParE1/3/4